MVLIVGFGLPFLMLQLLIISEKTLEDWDTLFNKIGTPSFLVTVTLILIDAQNSILDSLTNNYHCYSNTDLTYIFPPLWKEGKIDVILDYNQSQASYDWTPPMAV